MTNKIIAFAPASVGNAGSFYDLLGYALCDIGDFIELEKVDQVEDLLIWNKVMAGSAAKDIISLDHTENSAWIAASRIIDDHWKPKRRDFSLSLTLHKNLPIGSGLGSSAASAVAAVKAVVEILKLNLTVGEIINALKTAEEATSGNGCPDNIIPSYFGGLCLIDEDVLGDRCLSSGKTYTKINGGQDMISVIVYPEISVLTMESRRAVREYIYKQYLDYRFIDTGLDRAALNILNLVRVESVKAAGFLIAFMQNDISRVGAIMHNSTLLEGARSHLIPNFLLVKNAAIDAGAYGCTISGAGPAVVAITDAHEKAEKIRDSMMSAFLPIRTRWLISKMNHAGVSIIDSVEEFIERARINNNFCDVIA
ncbi:hypothetical protein ACFLWV_00635 [Chloroflexota bacterium]